MSCARCDELSAELEACAWEISPAMYEAKIDQLNAELARTQAQRDALLAVAKRSLNWLTSYPGGGPVPLYNEARAAIAAAEGNK